MNKHNKIKLNIKKLTVISILFSMLFTVYGCTTTYHNDSMGIENTKKIPDKENDIKNKDRKPPKINGLKFEKKLELKYAKGFDVFYYTNKKTNQTYKYIRVYNSGDYILVPDNSDDVKKIVGKKVQVIKCPSNNIYLAAPASMALFDRLDALSYIKFSGTTEENWYIENAKKAMENGDILFAGKYSQPDYEQLVSKKCSLAIESTMILHTPEVKEKLEELNIPVFIDTSSYENNPLGRTEWIKLYGAMTNKEDVAQEFFDKQEEKVNSVSNLTSQNEKTQKIKKAPKVAFFFVNSTGKVVVRKSDDYIATMIGLGGGKYAFTNLKNSNENNKSGSVTISMEEFYSKAKDCDYLIYNATIDAPIKSIDDLKSKNKLFKEFKAVKNNKVYSTDKYMYQATDIVGELVLDINHMINGKDEEMTFIKHIKE